MASGARLYPICSKPFLEGVAARVFPHHQPALRHADFLGRHDLVILAVLQHAVLVDAALMGESVASHDGLVGLDHETREVETRRLVL